MQRISMLLRCRNAIGSNSQLMRGPKKKKQAQLKIESTDIVNIFKDRSDPELMPIEQYPVYVQEFSTGIQSIHELTDGIQYNLPYKMPNQSLYRSYLRGIKRQKCKYLNEWHHIVRDPDPMDESKDMNNRLLIYNVFRKSKEQLDEEERLEEEKEAEEDDDDDDF